MFIRLLPIFKEKTTSPWPSLRQMVTISRPGNWLIWQYYNPYQELLSSGIIQYQSLGEAYTSKSMRI